MKPKTRKKLIRLSLQALEILFLEATLASNVGDYKREKLYRAEIDREIKFIWEMA